MLIYIRSEQAARITLETMMKFLTQTEEHSVEIILPKSINDSFSALGYVFEQFKQHSINACQFLVIDFIFLPSYQQIITKKVKRFQRFYWQTVLQHEVEHFYWGILSAFEVAPLLLPVLHTDDAATALQLPMVLRLQQELAQLTDSNLLEALARLALAPCFCISEKMLSYAIEHDPSIEDEQLLVDDAAYDVRFLVSLQELRSRVDQQQQVILPDLLVMYLISPYQYVQALVVALETHKTHLLRAPEISCLTLALNAKNNIYAELKLNLNLAESQLLIQEILSDALLLRQIYIQMHYPLYVWQVWSEAIPLERKFFKLAKACSWLHGIIKAYFFASLNILTHITTRASSGPFFLLGILTNIVNLLQDLHRMCLGKKTHNDYWLALPLVKAIMTPTF